MKKLYRIVSGASKAPTSTPRRRKLANCLAKDGQLADVQDATMWWTRARQGATMVGTCIPMRRTES